MRVAVIGLGLIGGSVARDLAAAGHEVLGYDRSRATLRAARRARVILPAAGCGFAGLDACDVCVIAVPVSDAPTLLARLARHLTKVALVTDVGSTKRSVVRAATTAGIGSRFVGAHPLAGDHRTGWGASRNGLFDGATLFLTPTRQVPAPTLRLAAQFWRALGARPRVFSAAKHDRLMAAASHMPQLVSSALGATLHAAGVERSALGPGGRDVTRLAGADRRIWSAIAMDNADLVVSHLGRFERELRGLRVAVERRRRAEIERRFGVANRWHRRSESPS